MGNDDWILTEDVERERLMVFFIAKSTGLSEAEVNRIYNLGKPWPIARLPNTARLAEETGVDLSAVDSVVGQMYETEAEQLEAKLRDREKRVAMGEPVIPIPELEKPTLAMERIEELVYRTGEDRETLLQVGHGISIYVRRLQNLT